MERGQGSISLQGRGWEQAFVLRSMHVAEALSEPFRYDLELLSDEAQHDPKKILGQPLTVAFELGERGSRYFSGVVTELSSRGSVGAHALYGVTLRPWLWLLSRTSNCRVFQKLSVPEIVKQIFRLHGFSDFAESLTHAYEAREYVVQYRETDLRFVSRLLEEEGIYYYFQHAAGKHTLCLCDSPSSHDVTPFYQALPYFPPDRQRHEQLDYVDGWEITQAVQSAGYAVKDFDFQKPRAPLLATRTIDPGHEHGAFEMFEYGAGHNEVPRGEDRALLRLEELRATVLHSVGSSNAPGLLVGATFALSEFPVEAHNHNYLVLSLDATLRNHALESGGDASDMYRCRFVAIDADQQYRPPRVTAKPTVQGIQTAIVVGKSGEEIWTDEYGRVKIKFHWDRYVPKDEENASCWVRVAQLWAGSNFGGMHIPRIGQEVIVEFIEGDPDRPIVVGRVYNFNNMPPYELPQNQTQSGIRSRSTLAGNPDNFNEIRFEDKKGQEELFIQAEKTQTTLVKGCQSIEVRQDRTLTVSGQQTTTVTKDEIQRYDANRTMDVAGTDTERIVGEHDGTYESGRTIKVNSKDDSLTVTGANKRASIDGEYAIDTAKKYELTHKDNRLRLENALSELTNGKCTLSFDGATATLSAADEIRLECGGASIRLKKDGTVVIAGAQTVTASGAQGAMELGPTGGKLSGLMCTVSGTTMSEVTGAMVKIN